jgi:hypothetical protein
LSLATDSGCYFELARKCFLLTPRSTTGSDVRPSSLIPKTGKIHSKNEIFNVCSASGRRRCKSQVPHHVAFIYSILYWHLMCFSQPVPYERGQNRLPDASGMFRALCSVRSAGVERTMPTSGENVSRTGLGEVLSLILVRLRRTVNDRIE